MKTRELLKISAGALLLSALVACSSKPKNYTALPANTDPSAAIEATKLDLQQARASQVDVLSPESYDNAKEAYDDALKAREKNRSNEKILERVAVANAYLRTANEKAQISRNAFDPLLEARKAAVEAKADSLAQKTFRKADRQMADLTSRAEEGDLTRVEKRRGELLGLYKQARIEALTEGLTAPARRNTEKTVKEGAKRYAPRTLASVQGAIDELIGELRHNGDITDAMREQGLRIEKASDRLLALTRSSKHLAGQDSENVAAELEKRDNAVEDLRMRTTAQQQVLNRGAAALERTTRELAEADKAAEPQKAYEQIRSQFSPGEADVLMDGNKIVVRMKALNFASSKSDIAPEQFGLLKKLGDGIKSVGASKVIVEGHTDAVGAAALNKDLSERRAQAVEKYLTANSEIPGNQVEAVGYGYSKPISDNKSKSGRAQNRRIDVILEL
ncbi:MAG: OmpA family protein [Bdellovibrionaceae bacterium]|nr:OmpA family protein [Pseudobdellovibrionaceae bacterium]MBX3034820.1 OmpA family protein [Pseudobdellovibrionaceae bacterium]